MRILQDHSKMTPEISQIELPDINAADSNGSLLYIVEAEQYVRQRGLPGACMSYDCDCFTGLHVK